VLSRWLCPPDTADSDALPPSRALGGSAAADADVSVPELGAAASGSGTDSDPADTSGPEPARRACGGAA
jgi:hypothetical protein